MDQATLNAVLLTALKAWAVTQEDTTIVRQQTQIHIVQDDQIVATVYGTVPWTPGDVGEYATDGPAYPPYH